MTPHKHAEVLRQIADGVPLSEFEVRGAGTNMGALLSIIGAIVFVLCAIYVIFFEE